MQPTAPDPTLHLPRLLCLHGGGVNAEVFRLQCRSIRHHLADRLRLVFVDGPFICPPHPSLVSVYGDMGPFRRWLRWMPEHRAVDAETVVHEIAYQIRGAMDEDDARGADGPWVGLLGFSQGAKVAASMLYTQQVMRELLGDRFHADEKDQPRWRFGVLLAGRAPLVALDDRVPLVKGIADASEGSTDFAEWPGKDDTAHLLRTPTIHMHGLADPGLEHHRRLLKQYCAPGTARLIEWDGDHRLPIKTVDVEKLTDAILEVSREVDVFK